ncbi:MAG: antitoxin component YwqK of YwqJK toxin-antitoxin module [Bacteroidia bacterium]
MWINICKFRPYLLTILSFIHNHFAMIEHTLPNPNIAYQDEVLILDQAPYNGIIKSHFENGNKQAATQYINGLRHGIHKEWYENGKLATARLFKEGMQHGECKKWWPNGQLKISCYYNDVKMHGLYESWHENGSVHLRKQYIQGKAWGRQQEWSAVGVEITNLCVSN